MKDLEKYAPYALIAVAAIAGLYFFWYKPQKDKEAAANAAAQAASDKALFEDSFKPITGMDKLVPIAPGTVRESLNPDSFRALFSRN